MTGDDRTRRKRRPRLARLLLTLIEDAGLNTFSPVSPLPNQMARIWLDALAASAGAQEFIRGRPLSDIVRFQPAMGEAAQERLMLALERPDASWPAGKSRIFYQIFMSDLVSREHVTFAWNGGERMFAPEKGVSINGESQEGVRPPYWVSGDGGNAGDGSNGNGGNGGEGSDGGGPGMGTAASNK
jgi:uncharacterized membrane protein YgcG